MPERLTVDTFAQLDDLPKRHRFPVLRSEVRQDSRTERDLLVKIALREAIATELELRGVNGVQVRVEDTEGVELSNVVATNLVGADEQLDLEAKNASIKALPTSYHEYMRTFKWSSSSAPP